MRNFVVKMENFPPLRENVSKEILWNTKVATEDVTQSTLTIFSDIRCKKAIQKLRTLENVLKLQNVIELQMLQNSGNDKNCETLWNCKELKFQLKVKTIGWDIKSTIFCSISFAARVRSFPTENEKLFASETEREREREREG